MCFKQNLYIYATKLLPHLHSGYDAKHVKANCNTSIVWVIFCKSIFELVSASDNTIGNGKLGSARLDLVGKIF